MNDVFFPEKLKNCACGKKHTFPLDEIISEKGAIYRVPDMLLKRGLKKPFLVFDENTYAACGGKLMEILGERGISYSQYKFTGKVEPDEKATGALAIAFDLSCDAVIGVGSGVINDLCKIFAAKTGRYYIIVATAPSMDGYASATSSMSVAGVKVSVPSKCADVIVGDTDVLKAAPIKTFLSGLGDMIAKYVSIAEWKISHLINGEYYCETVADMMKAARDACVANAAELTERKESAVKAVFDGLVIGGLCMAYAGMSRPASGAEHYVSHILDMRGEEFGEKTETHGIQCAIATLAVAKIYDKLYELDLGKVACDKDAKNFNERAWEEEMRAFFGKAAVNMIELEKKERKFDAAGAAKRREIIIEKQAEIKKIIKEEMPSAKSLEKLFSSVGLPLDFKAAGIDADLNKIVKFTAAIRDKYVASRLLFDLGITELVLESAKNVGGGE